MIKIENSEKSAVRRGGFGIEILHPGKALGNTDSGIGTIGRIDHALVTPGTLVPMHKHKDDEILTYIRSGSIRHTDSVGNDEIIDSNRLMLMNAGHEFQHEELVLEGDNVSALQIFMRPETSGLEPRVQFHEFTNADNTNNWRLVAGPEANAPLHFRSRSWIHDLHLKEAKTIALPQTPCEKPTHLIYVFSGDAKIDGQDYETGQSAIYQGTEVHISSQTDAEIVLFTTDESAPVFKGGMFSGNIL